jgi:Zn-finger nucleic acid-binding protein
MMNRQNFARISGVIIDLCRGCGVWLDNQELERILKFVQGGGIERSHAMEAEDMVQRQHIAAIAESGDPLMQDTSMWNAGTGASGVGRLVAWLAESFFRY